MQEKQPEPAQIEYDPRHSPLATQPLGRLLLKFAIPAILSMLVSALYNIVDQIFIGNSVGMLGNAATNVAFPLVTISAALALLLGIGSASNFNLSLGRGERERAGYMAGNGASLLAICGILLAVVVIVLLQPLIRAFGATDQVLPYAMTYTGITTVGLPFFIFATGGTHLVRADGSPTYSMLCMVAGALINTGLDALFIFVFDMGIAGAAWATVIGQVASGLMVVAYLFRFKNMKLTRRYLRPRKEYAKVICSLGVAAAFNQLAMTVAQIVMNNTLTHYGALSKYGSEIPLACVGVITKVNMVMMAFAIGVAQGCQPIVGFNYGAKNYNRVRAAYLRAAVAVTAISTIAFLGFQFFPREIVSIFGSGSEEYFEFSERYFRIFLLLAFANGIQPLTSTFFTSIGKAKKGLLLSMTRQILFLLPLILIFPMLFGIDGVMYAGPIADGAAAILAAVMVVREFKRMKRLPTQPSLPDLSA